MAKFIIQYGNNNGVFWKEVEADNLTSAKIKATMIANRHTEEVVMLAIENEEGELLASKNFAGKKAVWESHIEEAQAVVAVELLNELSDAVDRALETTTGVSKSLQTVEAVEDVGTATAAELFNKLIEAVDSALETVTGVSKAADVASERCVFTGIAPPAPISFVVEYNQETGEETCHICQNDIKFEIFGLIVPPLHHRIQLGHYVDEIHYTASKAAHKALCAAENNQVPMNQLCFIELKGELDVYVTIDEAKSLGCSPSYRGDINKDMRALLPPSKGIAQLMYAGISFNERCEPYLFGQDQAVVELCVNNSVSVYVREDYFVIKKNTDTTSAGNKFMLSEAAEKAVYYKLRDASSTPCKLGFVVTGQGIPVVVTDLEAAQLGETFSRIEIKR